MSENENGSTVMQYGTQITDVMKTLCDEIPARMNIVSILRDAHARIAAAVPTGVPPEFVAEKVVDVLREIASHAVDEFTRRTGQPFLWVDEPDPAEDPDNVLMSFGLDDKGNVTF